QAQLVAGIDRPAEFAAVDSRQVHHLLLGLRNDAQETDARHLSHRLQNEHSRHHRVARKMSLEELLVVGNVPDPYVALSLFELQESVDEEKRVTMRQGLQDLADAELHGQSPFDGLTTFFSSFATRCASSGRRANHALRFKNSWCGAAGIPDTTAP